MSPRITSTSRTASTRISFTWRAWDCEFLWEGNDKMLQDLFALFIALLAAGDLRAQQPAAKLDTTLFVTVGDGLAAGMSNYGLMQEAQEKSFPAQIARQMNTAFPQPLIQGPGLGDVIGYQALPSRIPAYPATTVRVDPAPLSGAGPAPTLFVFNLSIPGAKLADVVALRPAPPLIQKNNRKQTLVNMMLGFPALILEKDAPLWSQLEYGEAMNPTFVLIQLGYSEAFEAIEAGDPNLAAAAFRATYATIVKRLRATNAEVMVTTVPDPLDTAYFTTSAVAASMLRTNAASLAQAYGLAAGDLFTRNALSTIGNGLLRGGLPPLPPGSILRAAAAADVRARVPAINAEILNVATENGA